MAALLSVLLAVAACSLHTPSPGQSESRSAGITPSPGPGGVLTAPLRPDADNRILLPGDLWIEIPAGALSARGQLVVSPVTTDLMPVALGVAHHVEIKDATLIGKASLSLPTGSGPDPTVSVLGSEGVAKPVQGARRGDRYTAPMSASGTWLFLDWQKARTWAISRLERILADAASTQPPCATGNELRGSGIKATSSEGNDAAWCLRQRDGKLDLRITNTRGYAVTAEFTSGVTPVRKTRLSSRFPALVPFLDRPSAPGNRLILVDAGETVDFDLAANPPQQSVSLRATPEAYLGSAVEYAVDVVAMVYRPLGEDPGPLAKQELATCAKAAFERRGKPIDGSKKAADELVATVKLAFGCVSSSVEQALAGSKTEPRVLAVFTWLWSEVVTAATRASAKAGAALDPRPYAVRVDLGAREPRVPSVALLAEHDLCEATAIISGSVVFTHPTWGRVVLVTCSPPSPPGPSGAAVVDAAGVLRWTYAWLDNPGLAYRFTLHRPATDASGNFFIDYDPGRYPGLMVLRPKVNGMRVLYGPSRSEYTEPSMYYAELIGPGADGRFTVKQSHNDCNPTCAGGTTTSWIYRWNGSSYVR